MCFISVLRNSGCFNIRMYVLYIDKSQLNEVEMVLLYTAFQFGAACLILSEVLGQVIYSDPLKLMVLG
jgi:hypothetical protein